MMKWMGLIKVRLEIGIVIDYEKTTNNVLLKVKGKKIFYIPKESHYINKINISDAYKSLIPGLEVRSLVRFTPPL